ncbi:flagellar hook-basal body complex protein FliE [Chenggangzhangella methanolivorans]|uniref:Flagellar hook-basal body complex protein FliE n=1 Tax=Chenggangzhangella methanolivorans TaxID=1437009 RepID=A0A9E6RGF8_9HYPH|nr:flagellar hook-basal body complex protein FliE [Chenggangzhangella methanolivorans]QZO00981.1 flagellar hook-basal body complex protein FliE [Chenggangzhangella methanolivorans]
MTSPTAAASAYASISGLMGGAAGGVQSPLAAPKGGGFGDMLEQAISGFAEQGRQTDAKAMEAISGKGDVVDVVTAVAESELALDTLVSVRDKVIAAYEEIMRMPI